MSFQQKIYNRLPLFFQNFLIGVFNKRAYKDRHGGKYKQFRATQERYQSISADELKEVQQQKFISFLQTAISNSKFYREKYKGLLLPETVDQIDFLPIISKDEFRSKVEDIYTIPAKGAAVTKTGGTTGFSLEVRFTMNDIQERFAILDTFRAKTGYVFGKKTAWFSGKSLLTNKDVSASRFWKTDILNNIRYYSTFHIKDNYLDYYVKNIIQFQPEYIIGFPTSITEVARHGLKMNLSVPKGTVKAIFPTSETTTPEMYDIMERFYNAKVYNQYASSEGAPFIFECSKGKLHLDIANGVYEVLDDNNREAESGRLVVTSFTTYGTPLIRYDIGDTVEKGHETCDCGNHNPVIKTILGRIDDYVYSPENGKINTVNMANATKGVHGLVKYQVQQDALNKIIIIMVTDRNLFTEKDLSVFLENWRERVGRKMEIETKIVADIPVEKSGKYRIVKNSIKHLIDK